MTKLVKIPTAILFLLLKVPAISAAPNKVLHAGFATTDITPPLGVDLLAFAQNRKATSVHDPLMAHAVVLEVDGKRIAIVGTDLCAVTLELAGKIRTEVERATGIPGDRVMVNSTHTHSGPATMKWLNLIGEMDEGYMKDLHLRIAKAIIQASQNLQPASLYYGSAPVEGVAANREYKDGPVDKNVRVLKFMHGNQLAGFIANYSVHPLTVGPKSPGVITGDLVAVADTKVLSDYPGATGIFLQGAAGDQNPVACCPDDKDGLEALDKLSGILAGSIREALRGATRVNIDGIDMEARPISLPRVPLDKSMVVLRLLNATRWLQRPELPPDMRREFQFEQASARAVLERYGHPGMTETISEIQVARIGDVLILGNPGEPYITLGNEEAELLRGHKLLVAGYTNDRDRYIATPDRFDLEKNSAKVTTVLSPIQPTDSEYGYSFACYRVPWMAGEFPFRRDVGDVLVQGMVQLARDVLRRDSLASGE